MKNLNAFFRFCFLSTILTFLAFTWFYVGNDYHNDNNRINKFFIKNSASSSSSEFDSYYFYLKTRPPSKPISLDSSRFLKFDYVSNFFIQSQSSKHGLNPDKFDVYAANSSFGLINRSKNYDRWIKFDDEVNELIRNQPKDVSHKVVFIARHGQGFHNVAESNYGTPLWNCKWSEENSDGNMTWGPDARLTPLGKHQAKIANQAWARELRDGLKLPQSFISSPLSRAISTMEITGSWKHSKTRPVIKEEWRENIGLHTCDKRRSKEEIRKDYPFLRFESDFSDGDELWTKNLQETDPQLDIRIRKALSGLFLQSPEREATYVSITAHSGVISSLLRVIGHHPFPVQTGGMIPLVIRAKIKGTPTRPPHPGPSGIRPNCPKV